MALCNFIKNAILGGLSLAGMSLAPIGDQVAYASQSVKRDLSPSDLRITDMRVTSVLRSPSIRIYCDTTSSSDPDEFARRLKAPVDAGYTSLKMDAGIGLVRDTPGTVVNAEFWENQPGGMSGWNRMPGSYSNTKHPITRVQVTDKGIDTMTEYLEVMRAAVGYEIPVGVDHLGHFGYNEAIKIARAAEKYSLAFLEDLIPWQLTDQWRRITDSTTTPTQTGEDIFLLEGFKNLLDNRAVDMIHPDPVGAGGLMETKKIGDYAKTKGISMMLHHASSPVSLMAVVHAAAATQNFIWLEHHFVDLVWYDDLVTGIEKPIVQNGYINVPEKPGIGVEGMKKQYANVWTGMNPDRV